MLGGLLGLPVNPRTRKAITVMLRIAGVAILIYVGFLAYALYFWPPFPDLPREVAEVMTSDAIAFVPNSGDGIDILRPGRKPETMKDRATLTAWLCGTSVPRNTSVLFTETKRAQGVLEMRLVRIPRPPIPIECPTTARFYAVRDGQIAGSHE